ncbi:hypothetical protein GMMP15_80049 [Candidatus Magnetomoraceae bacterium gMMP-15]
MICRKNTDRPLPERISLAGIARVVGVSERWLQNYVNEKYVMNIKYIFLHCKKIYCLYSKLKTNRLPNVAAAFSNLFSVGE